MQIDLVFFEGCPHAAAARTRLREALTSLGLSARWNEWDTGDPMTPERLRGYSSPTVLVNGIDVDGKIPATGAGCAVGGGPSLRALRDAIAAGSP